MHWIYILQCDSDENNDEDRDIYYVGETERLYRRLKEHLNGNGGTNTSNFRPYKLEGIYPISKINKFIDLNEFLIYHLSSNYNNLTRSKTLSTSYGLFRLNTFITKWNDEIHSPDHLQCENFLVECMMKHSPDCMIRGGKHTRFDNEYEHEFSKDDLEKLPLCKCGVPADIKRDPDKNILFFRCAKKNIWGALAEDFEELCEDIIPCNFYQVYSLYSKVKDIWHKEKTLELSALFKKSTWLSNIPSVSTLTDCLGGCGKSKGNYKPIIYPYKSGQVKPLCLNCFTSHNTALKKKYSSKICLIDTDSD